LRNVPSADAYFGKLKKNEEIKEKIKREY